MRKPNRIHIITNKLFCLIIALMMFNAPLVVSAKSTTSTSNSVIGFDHYDNINSNPFINDPDAPAEDSMQTRTEVNKTKEEIEVQEFNGRFLDTIIYIIGALSGVMMILQISLFTWCRLHPGTNQFLEKLKKIGIDGYEEGWIVPTIKILLLGVFSFLCMGGYIKDLIIWILSVFTFVTS